jgi:hypothetical protein
MLAANTIRDTAIDEDFSIRYYLLNSVEDQKKKSLPVPGSGS